mmetsp:Transcript_10242/g.62583  ORF Transcript_10242/g.62583 Transcript_10242/m.62583 type:complete len:252 (+) Transcript_10242:1441-2196(+)
MSFCFLLHCVGKSPPLLVRRPFFWTPRWFQQRWTIPGGIKLNVRKEFLGVFFHRFHDQWHTFRLDLWFSFRVRVLHQGPGSCAHIPAAFSLAVFLPHVLRTGMAWIASSFALGCNGGCKGDPCFFWRSLGSMLLLRMHFGLGNGWKVCRSKFHAFLLLQAATWVLFRGRHLALGRHVRHEPPACHARGFAQASQSGGGPTTCTFPFAAISCCALLFFAVSTRRIRHAASSTPTRPNGSLLSSPPLKGSIPH